MTPILLTWNLPAKKAAKARMLAMRSGVRVAAVETWQYLQPLGSFTGDCGSMESLYDGAGFSEEMLLFAHFPETLLSRFLQGWKTAGLPTEEALHPVQEFSAYYSVIIEKVENSYKLVQFF